MEVVGIIFGSIIAVMAIIFHHITKWKEMKMMSPEGEKSMTDLRLEAEKLEKRLRNMERILDGEIPGWRSRYDD